MNNKVFNYKGKDYPVLIKDGNACKYCLPFAEQFCIGEGLDIGGFNDWTFPGARAVNITLGDGYDAYNLPEGSYDYIFSSHTLEHLPDYVKALEYWKQHLQPGGVLFLYLPHPEMEYWRPENNRKHLHLFYPQDVAKALETIGYKDVLTSERDLYWSFTVVAFA
jgi:SAM-dependent methyltransferase